MIFVRGATKAYPAEVWEKASIGTEDEFGNAFDIIELLWNKSRFHPSAPYAKTRGFDDTEIRVDSTSPTGVKIRYRQKVGGITWLRQFGNAGPFIGKLAKTPRNMRKLATHFKDGLWIIRNPAIKKEVEAMHTQIWDKMTEEEKQFNKDRIRTMHVGALEASYNMPDTTSDAEKQELEREKVSLQKQRIDLDRREAEINSKGDALIDRKAESIREGKAATQYNEAYLSNLKLSELRKTARKEFKLNVAENWKKETIVEKILEQQDKLYSTEPEEPVELEESVAG